MAKEEFKELISKLIIKLKRPRKTRKASTHHGEKLMPLRSAF